MLFSFFYVTSNAQIKYFTDNLENIKLTYVVSKTFKDKNNTAEGFVEEMSFDPFLEDLIDQRLVTRYDSLGNVVDKYYYNIDSTYTSVIDNKYYYSNKKLDSVISLEYSDNIISRKIITVYEDGRVLKILTLPSDHLWANSIEYYIYNEAHLVEKKLYNISRRMDLSDNVKSRVMLYNYYSYDDKGRVSLKENTLNTTKHEYYDSKNVVKETIKGRYDDKPYFRYNVMDKKGNIVEIYTLKKDVDSLDMLFFNNEPDFIFTYSYDNHNNWTTMIYEGFGENKYYINRYIEYYD